MELITYLLKVSACTVLFFAIYLLVLRRLTFFKTNRFYLLFTLLISFIIPTLNFTIEREVIATEVIYDQTTALNDETQFTQFQTPNQVTYTPIVEESFDWYSILPHVYFGIVACLLIIATWRILQLVKHAKYGTERVNGLKIVSKTKGFTNCSFFHYVFIDNENLSEVELQVLLKHEQVHATQLHSIDKVLLIVVKAFLWFNPVVYLYDKALEQAHEYEADEATSQSFGAEQYANLLLRLAIAKSEMPLVHNFVKSPIKERIKMLFNSKSTNMKKLLYLLALPVGLGLLWGFTVKVVEVSKVNQLAKENTTTKKILSLDEKLWGKKLKGKVKSILETEVGEVLNFKYDDRLIRVYNSAKGKVSVGDEVYITIQGTVKDLKLYDAKGNVLKELDAPCYGMSMMKTLDGKVLFDGDIKTANKNVVINDEKPITTQSQQFSNLKKPVLIFATSVRVDNKNEIDYIKNGKMKIQSKLLEAEEMAYDTRNETLTAKNGKLKLEDGSVISEQYIFYDLKQNSYITNKTPGNKIHVNSDAYELLGSLKANNDSLKMTKLMGGMLVLSGKVKLNVDGYALTGKAMQVQNGSNLITAHVATFIDKNGSKISGDVIEFDLISKNYKVTKPVGTAYTN